MTVHIGAKLEDIKENVIMCGDPLRVKFIAEHYLEDAYLVNNIRLALAYTGKYKGKDVTVMTSGMGMPSMGIYAFELYNNYNVKKIIRLGSCGALKEEIKLKDVILAEKAYTSSNFAYQYSGMNEDFAESSSKLNDKLISKADELNISIKIGVINTSDVFYSDYYDEKVKENYCLAVEMECFGLFYLAKKFGKEAAAILTVSNNLVTKEEMSSKERETSFIEAMKLVLESLL